MDPTPPPHFAASSRSQAYFPSLNLAPVFHKEKHISYWLRCLRSPLPYQYTSNDSNRMTLAFFTISALDLLGVLHSLTTQNERDEYTRWIYRCQHPDGGFRAFPGTDFGSRRNEANKIWDPANLPATYFALATLCVLGDDLQRLRRRDCLRWLSRMQRTNGNFGQTLGEDGTIEGGMDTRFGYCAMAVRWILRDAADGPVDDVADVDCEALVHCIRRSITYDGGVSDEPFHEAHAGFTYCAIGALDFLGRLPTPGTSTEPVRVGLQSHEPGLADSDHTIRWLLSRLTTMIEEEDSDDEGMGNDGEAEPSSSDGLSSGLDVQTPQSSFSSNSDAQSVRLVHSTEKSHSAPARSLEPGGLQPVLLGQPEASLSPSLAVEAQNMPFWAGFNGRPNKLADTCYAFWVGGSLDILKSLHLVDAAPLRRYLLEKTQHPMLGGFGKHTGTMPDMFHAYLGLAALSLLDTKNTVHTIEEGATHQAREQYPLPAADSAQMEGAGPAPGLDREHQSQLLKAAESSHRILADGKIRDGSQDDDRMLRSLDAALCVSTRARKWIEGLHERDGKLQMTRWDLKAKALRGLDCAELPRTRYSSASQQRGGLSGPGSGRHLVIDG